MLALVPSRELWSVCGHYQPWFQVAQGESAVNGSGSRMPAATGIPAALHVGPWSSRVYRHQMLGKEETGSRVQSHG